MQVDGGGQSAPMPQPLGAGTHWPISHIEPGGQVPPFAQSAATHIPSEQVEPTGQLAQPLGTHEPLTQVAPAGQLPSVQPCATQLPLVQVEPGGQLFPSGPQVPVTGWQLVPTQVVPDGQGGQPSPRSSPPSPVRPQPEKPNAATRSSARPAWRATRSES
jgi:hypothetical protein